MLGSRKTSKAYYYKRKVTMSKIAWGMIVKASHDELPHIKRALKSVLPHVDQAFITITYKKGEKPSYKVVKALQAMAKVTVSEYEWEGERFHFGNARIFNYQQIPEEYEFWGWCDADDTLENGEKIKDIISKWPKHVDAIELKYEYQHDEQGNPIDVLYLPRLLRHNGARVWDGKPIHEVITSARIGQAARNEEVWFKHHSGGKRRKESLHRNVEALEALLEDETEKPDPRTLYYLAGTYYDLEEYGKALFLYEKYLQLSGWDSERQQAWMSVGRIHRINGDLPKAKEALLKGLGEDPRVPEPYVELGKNDIEEENWGKAIHWLELAVIQKAQPGSVSQNPLYGTWIPYIHLAQAHLNIGGKSLTIAHEWAKKAYAISPDKGTKEIMEAADYMAKERDQLNKFAKELDAVKDDAEKTAEIIKKIPESLQDNPLVLAYKKRHTEPKTWENSIVIYTGEAQIGEWGPWSLDEGIGGSEEAVVRLSKHLVNLGWEVTVFGTPGIHAGTYDGVVWKNHWEVDMRDTFDVFISWRSPWLFDADIKARKKYLWLHDVMEQGDMTKERMDKVDKVMVLSKYHRTCFPDVPDDKFFFTGNGIDPEDFDREVERIPGKMVYTSSHVRGLAHLYDIWPEVKEAVPEATLDVFYGWHSYDKINADNPERLNWKTQMVQLANDLEGVTDHGKVSQDRIVDEMMSADVWPYPTLFTEIYCITAVKAQAAGAYPVTSRVAALDEMVQHGDTMELTEWDDKQREEYKNMLIKALKNKDKDRTEMMKWATNHSWSSVAEQWTKEFGNAKQTES